MANILQVTDTPASSGLHNLSDLNTQGVRQPAAGNVNSAGAAGAATPEEAEINRAIADFESSFASFAARFRESADLTDQLSQLLFRDGADTMRSADPETAKLWGKLMAAIHVDTPEELAELLEEQHDSQAKFTGELFDTVRNLLDSGVSGAQKDTILAFLKSYSDATSGTHLLQQMRTIGQEISSMMVSSQRDEYEDILSRINWNAADGDTGENAETINQQLVPFLSKYIARTHDYGPVRTAAVLFTLYAVKYENGNKGQLLGLLQRLTDSEDFRKLYQGDAAEEINRNLTAAAERRTRTDSSSSLLNELLLRGAQGKLGTENAARYTRAMNSMLTDQSVFLPLLHVLVPFRYQNQEVMSELWVDPDAGKQEGQNAADQKRLQLLLKFNIPDLGNFEMALGMTGKDVELQMVVPPSVTARPETIAGDLSRIMQQNDLHAAGISITPGTGHFRLEDVFPGIREKEKGINVRI